jgi:hypothetical protein
MGSSMWPAKGRRHNHRHRLKAVVVVKKADHAVAPPLPL